MRILAVGSKAPTLVALRTALPPEGALRLRPGKAGSAAPAGGCGHLRLLLSYRFLQAKRAASTAAAPLSPLLKIPYSPSYSRAPLHPLRLRGFTLIELLVVVAIMAIATAGVGMALRDNSGTALEREAQRLAVLLESARAQSRMTASPVRWRPTATGFIFEGLATSRPFPQNWLSQDVRVTSNNPVPLGPEPIIGPQRIQLVSISQPGRSLTLATDGLRPFSVLADGGNP